MKVITKILFCFLIIFTLFGCMQNQETNEVDHDDEQKQTIYNLAVESGYNGTYEEWLVLIRRFFLEQICKIYDVPQILLQLI